MIVVLSSNLDGYKWRGALVSERELWEIELLILLVLGSWGGFSYIASSVAFECAKKPQAIFAVAQCKTTGNCCFGLLGETAGMGIPKPSI